jgi:hypothetical protein
MKPTLLVMAAGTGSRYGALKQIEPVGPHGETLLDYSVHDALAAGFGKVVFIVRGDIEDQFRAAVGARWESRTEVLYARQELTMLPAGFEVPADRSKPWGTGHAVLVAEEFVAEPFVVINADDFYGREAYELVREFFETRTVGDELSYAMVGYRLRDTLSEHGHVSRGVCEYDSEGLLRRIWERQEIVRRGGGAEFTDDNGETHTLTGEEVVSMNFWAFSSSVFGLIRSEFEHFLKLHELDPSVEFLLPAVVGSLVSWGIVSVKVLPSAGPWLGVTYREDGPHAAESIARLIGEGVYPERLWD